MKYADIIKPATIVDYSTLLTILENTTKAIFDPINLFNNIHVYTQAVSDLRSAFLEPFSKQVIRNTPDLLNAIALRPGFDINYKQGVYVILGIHDVKQTVRWINLVNDSLVPMAAYTSDKIIYESIDILNEATHKGQNSLIRNKFVNAFFACYTIYRRVFPDAHFPIEFATSISVETYISNTLKEMITAKEEGYNSILTALKNIEKQNDEKANELKEYTNKITEQRVLIENLRIVKTDYEKRIGTLQNSIANYISLKEIWDKKLDEEYVEPLIRTTTLNKIEAWKEYDLFKNERQKLNEKLKLLI